MFYRLFDKQCDRYMTTGYNSGSLSELIEEYISFTCFYEGDESDYSKFSTKEMINIIQSDEFEIDSSENMFEEHDGY